MNRWCIPQPASPRHIRRQAGISLIEVMVGLTVGLFVIGAATRLAITTLVSSAVVSDVTRLNLQAQVVMDAVGRHIRQGASRALVAADKSASSVPVVWAQSPVTTGTLVLGPNPGDATSLRVVFHSNQTSSADYPATTSTPLLRVLDCQGSSNANGVNDVTFSLDNNNVLRCNNQTNGAQPLLDDVQGFAWRAVQREANDNLTYLKPATAVGNINLTAVEVCLHLRGQLNNASTNNAQTIVNCQGATVTPADGRVHRVYRQLFTMRSVAG